MIYKEFKDGVKLSVLGMGNMRLPVREEEGSPIDYERAREIIDLAMGKGVNYYDTAYIYHNGESERFVGEALKKYPRDSFYVADKFNYQAQPDYRIQFQEQLDRLQMERIDFYLLHGIQDHFAREILTCGCVEYFQKLKEEGKIRFLGFSFHGKPQTLREILAVCSWDFVQIQLNYYDWYYEDAKELYEILEQAGIPVMVMEPVHGGALAALTPEADALFKEAAPNKSVASWALRWVAQKPAVQVILSGMSNLEQLEDNIDTVENGKTWTEDDEELVKKACALYRPTVSAACTKCRYCCPDCPQELDIPYLLSIYNAVKLDGDWRASSLKALPEDRQPSACIGCGSCESHCPQSLSIPKYMKELAEVMERLG